MIRVDNPKTTAVGLGAGVVTMLQVLGIPVPTEAITGIISGGLTLLGLFGKDNNK